VGVSSKGDRRPPVGKIGEENSRLLGSFLVAQFQLAAIQRANTGEGERRDFHTLISTSSSERVVLPGLQQSKTMLIGVPCMPKLDGFVFIEAPIPRKQSLGQDLIDTPQSA
jgi:hypothetical protein